MDVMLDINPILSDDQVFRGRRNLAIALKLRATVVAGCARRKNLDDDDWIQQCVAIELLRLT